MIDESGPIDLIHGRYELLESLGAGGMGVVYRGRDLLLGRAMAVKRCKVDDPQWRSMFANEAKSQSRLFHPNIVSIFDFGYDFDGLPYIVMEYFEGRSVQDMLGRVGRLDVPRAVQIVRTVGEALAVAHARKITHRDVKPSNLLIGPNGMVKLSDFGLATRRGEGAHLGGTPMYAPPEQGNGDEDHRVDVYALAMTLTCLVVGSPISREQVGDSKDFPVSLRSAVLTALDSRPEVRQKDIDTFLAQLPPASHGRVGTPGAVAHANAHHIKPSIKSAHREFVFDLGDVRDSGKGKPRVIVGYAVEPTNGTAFYVIWRQEAGTLDLKHAYKANNEYGALLGFSEEQMKQLIEMPQQMG